MQIPVESSDELPYNLNNELAKERTQEAADRTLLAWIRTSLSLIGFGFGIPAIIKTIESTRIGQTINPHYITATVGMSFIGIGIFAILAALREHRRVVRAIQRNRFVYQSSQSAEIVGIALLLVGLASLVGVLVRTFNL